MKKSKHLGCVFQDTEPPKSKSILRKSTKSLGSDRSVHFSKGTLHFVTIRERKGPSQGVIQNCETQERNPCAPKLEDGTQEETLQQERCALRKAYHLRRNLRRELAADSGALMRTLNRKDLNLAELETVRVSRNLRAVITANGEVQTSEEAQVHVHDLDLFVTVQIPEVTPAVLSLGKLCEKHGYSYEWTSGQKPQLTKHGRKSNATRKLRTDLFPGVIDKFFQFDCKYIFPHRYRRTHLMIHRRVQQQHEVKMQAFRHRETACETCQSGQRSSQKIWKTKGC